MPGLVGTSSLKTSLEKTQAVECDGCNGDKHCICLCANFCPNCNMPKCRALRETSWVPGTLTTEHTREYTEKSAPRTALPGKAYVESLGKFDPTTTNRADFTRKNGKAAQSVKPGNGAGPGRPFDGKTTYNTYHDGKKGPRSEAMDKKLNNYSGPFYGTTTHQADYQAKGLGDPSWKAPQYELLNVPFDGQSTYKADFDKKNIPVRDPRAKAPLLQSSHVDNYTTYGLDYVPLPLSKARAGECCANTKHTAVHVNLTIPHGTHSSA